MDCERFDKTNMELLYGELDELSEAAALRHLHHCTRCRDLWGHLRTTRELAEIPLEEPPDGLFENVLQAEAYAHKTLPARERFSRAISILAGYAMRPQLAMAAVLLLMIGSSLVFVRNDPTGSGEVSVTELGTPQMEPSGSSTTNEGAQVFEGDREALRHAGSEEGIPPSALEAKSERSAGPTEKGATEAGAQTKAQGYDDAMVAYQEGRYAEAEGLFSEVASSGGERAASAALHEGHAARNGSGCQRAAALYDSVAAQYGGSTVADEASWHAASCYRALGQLKRAAAHYTSLQSRPAYASRAQKVLEELNAQMAIASASSKVETPDSATSAIAGKKAASAPVESIGDAPASKPEPPASGTAAPPVVATPPASN